MASADDSKADIPSPQAKSPPAEKGDVAPQQPDVVSVELPAPAGWKKKLTPKKGGTPRRKEILFISPTGEEIKHKKQLDQYLRSHPGGPLSSEFGWGSACDTPRRSARISEKVKAVGTPVGEPPKKRGRKSSSKKTAKEKDSADKEYVAPAEDRSVLESKYNVNTELNEAEDSMKKEGAASAVSDLDGVDQSSKNEPNEELKTETTIVNQPGEVKSEENVDEPEEKEGKAEDKNIEVTNMPEKKTEEKNIEATNLQEEKTKRGNKSTLDVKALEQFDKPMEEVKFEKAADVPKEEELKTEGQNAETNKVEPVASVVEAEKENEKSTNFDTPKQPSKTSTVSC